MLISDIETLQIRAILDLQAKGWVEADIRKALKISRRTLYRRLATERSVRRRSRPPMAALPVAVAC